MVLNTDQFDYHKDINTFTAEASSLEFRPGTWPMSFFLKSQTTGRCITMVHKKDLMSDGGEFFGRSYKVVPYHEELMARPEGFVVEIFND